MALAKTIAVAMRLAQSREDSSGGSSVTTGPFRRVLVGWDGSADATEALTAAVSIAGSDAGHVVALAVVPQARHTETDDEDDAERSAIRRAEERFERAQQSIPAIREARVKLAIVGDRHAGHAVCAYARTHGFDLLVLGRHGDGGAFRTRLGSVAEAAAKDGMVPVLLVSPP